MQDNQPTPSPSPADDQAQANVNAPAAATAPATVTTEPNATAVDPAAAQEPKPYWPEDWREKAANGDEKRLNRLSRYASPQAALEALIEAQNKIASGALKTAKPKGESPEELAEWRKENGIPEKAEDYDLSLPNGLVIGEEDKPIIDQFVKAMHGVNATPDVVKAAVAQYYELQEAQMEQMQERNAEQRINTLAELKAEWGGEFNRNLNALKTFIDSAPGGLAEDLVNAALPDGTQLLNHPGFVRWMTQMAMETNPQHTIAPAAGSDRANAVLDEINKFKGMMADNNSEYWKGPNAQRNQNRYRELVELQSKIK